MPITDRKEAKESGFAQVREALMSFAGDVVSAEFGQWGGQLIDEETGKPAPPREFLEIECANVEALEVTEELAIPIDEWNFRTNCSDYKGSFWVEDFLASADKFKLLIPDDLVGKRVTWKKFTRKGSVPKYDSTGYIITKVEPLAKAAPKVVAKVAPVVVTTPITVVEAPGETAAEYAAPAADPMELATDLAVGKSETQFRSAVSLHPEFAGSPLLPLAKAGALTRSLVETGKLVEVVEGDKTVYRKPE